MNYKLSENSMCDFPEYVLQNCNKNSKDEKEKQTIKCS